MDKLKSNKIFLFLQKYGALLAAGALMILYFFTKKKSFGTFALKLLDRFEDQPLIDSISEEYKGSVSDKIVVEAEYDDEIKLVNELTKEQFKFLAIEKEDLVAKLEGDDELLKAMLSDELGFKEVKLDGDLEKEIKLS